MCTKSCLLSTLSYKGRLGKAADGAAQLHVAAVRVCSPAGAAGSTECCIELHCSCIENTPADGGCLLLSAAASARGSASLRFPNSALHFLRRAALAHALDAHAQAAAGCRCAAAGARGCRRRPRGCSRRAARCTTAAAGTSSGSDMQGPAAPRALPGSVMWMATLVSNIPRRA